MIGLTKSFIGFYCTIGSCIFRFQRIRSIMTEMFFPQKIWKPLLPFPHKFSFQCPFQFLRIIYRIFIIDRIIPCSCTWMNCLYSMFYLWFSFFLCLRPTLCDELKGAFIPWLDAFIVSYARGVWEFITVTGRGLRCFQHLTDNVHLDRLSNIIIDYK